MEDTDLYKEVLGDEAEYLAGETGASMDAVQKYLGAEQAFLISRGLALPADADIKEREAFAERMDSLPEEELPVIRDDELLDFIIAHTGLDPETARKIHGEELAYLAEDEEDEDEDAEADDEPEDGDDGKLIELDEDETAAYMSEATGIPLGKCLLFLIAEQEFYVKTGIVPASDREEDLAAFREADPAPLEEIDMAEVVGYVEGRTGISREDAIALADAETDYMEQNGLLPD